MDIALQIIGITLFVLLIALSIALHELGHMVPAKKFGVKVTEYMIGFGPKIWSRRRGETDYGVKLIPLGGYVRIIGMLPPANKPETSNAFFPRMIREAREGSFKEIEPGEEDRVFYKLPVRKRLIVMFGGPFMNLAFALILFTVLLSLIGIPQPSSTINRVVPCLSVSTGESTFYDEGTGQCPAGYVDTPAVEAGLQPGDVIVSVDGIPVEENWRAFTEHTRPLPGEETTLIIRRDGTEQTVALTVAQHTVPVYSETTGRPTGETEARGFIGIQPGVTYATVPVTKIPSFMWDMIVMSTQGLINFPVKLYQLTTNTIIGGGERDVEGPVSVVGVSRLGGEVAATDQPIRDKAITFVLLLASLNLFLFLFNLLPILPLDGGHIASALAESIRRGYARMRGKPDPGLIDTARLIPLAYVFTTILILVSLLVIYADVVKPISLSG